MIASLCINDRSWERCRAHLDMALHLRGNELEWLVGGRQAEHSRQGWKKRGQSVDTSCVWTKATSFSHPPEKAPWVWTGAGSNLPQRMTVYQGPRRQGNLRETGLLASHPPHVSSFAFLKKWSWQLEKPGGFSQQLSSVVSISWERLLFFSQKENNMPLFEHQKGRDCLLPGEVPEVQEHGRNSSRGPYLAAGKGWVALTVVGPEALDQVAWNLPSWRTRLVPPSYSRKRQVCACAHPMARMQRLLTHPVPNP